MYPAKLPKYGRSVKGIVIDKQNFYTFSSLRSHLTSFINDGTGKDVHITYPMLSKPHWVEYKSDVKILRISHIESRYIICKVEIDTYRSWAVIYSRENDDKIHICFSYDNDKWMTIINMFDIPNIYFQIVGAQGTRLPRGAHH